MRAPLKARLYNILNAQPQYSAHTANTKFISGVVSFILNVYVK